MNPTTYNAQPKRKVDYQNISYLAASGGLLGVDPADANRALYKGPYFVMQEADGKVTGLNEFMYRVSKWKDGGWEERVGAGPGLGGGWTRRAWVGGRAGPGRWVDALGLAPPRRRTPTPTRPAPFVNHRQDVFAQFNSDYDYLLDQVQNHNLTTRFTTPYHLARFHNRIAGAIHRGAPGSKVTVAAHSMPYNTDVKLHLESYR